MEVVPENNHISADSSGSSKEDVSKPSDIDVSCEVTVPTYSNCATSATDFLLWAGRESVQDNISNSPNTMSPLVCRRAPVAGEASNQMENTMHNQITQPKKELNGAVVRVLRPGANLFIRKNLDSLHSKIVPDSSFSALPHDHTSGIRVIYPNAAHATAVGTPPFEKNVFPLMADTESPPYQLQSKIFSNSAALSRTERSRNSCETNPFPTVILPNPSLIQSELQRTFDFTSFKPISDDFEDRHTTPHYNHQGKERNALNNMKIISTVKETDIIEPKPRLSKETLLASEIYRREKNNHLLQLVYYEMMRKWDEYLEMSPSEIHKYECENVNSSGFTEDAITMVENTDLSVWQIIDDITPPLFQKN